jgi:gas vesicle protein
LAEYDFDEPYIVIEKKSGDFGSFLLGLAFGAGVALLLAPKTGAATRRELRRGVRRVRTTAEDVAHGVAERVTDSFDTAKQQVEDRIDAARSNVEMRKAQVADAIHVGRAAARQAKEELERRIAQTKASYQSSGTRSGSATEG